MKRFVAVFVGFSFVVFTILVWIGLVYCTRMLPPDQMLTDLHYSCFGVGSLGTLAIIITPTFFAYLVDCFYYFLALRKKSAA